MQIHVGERREGDVVTLRVLEGVSESVLMDMLKSEGIELVFGPIEQGRVMLELRAPRRMLVVVEKAPLLPVNA
ncbi:hypothetical protein [Metapseudomonas furukawaii]|jgi:hypothetical protein|uniref:hypothetical protein n=1 Tax=Metapseudomonas furukawaii TaxID=1149133 RepID=UPI00055DEC85|nr:MULTISPECIES: hypothetical protein [Pseudomonas]OWJ95898.1 hypothetical protein B6S59_08165 [Pseudomonas sp. A46]WAG78262.1 hypothetical protein LMK08_23335 [Pseudomonas furukawaii]